MGSLKQWLQVLCDEEILAKVFKLCTEEQNFNKSIWRLSHTSSETACDQASLILQPNTYDYNAKLCTIRPISYKSDIIAS